MANHSHRGWRRVLGCVLAYALALQGFILTLDIGGAAYGAAPDRVFAGFELCHHGGAPLPDTPAPSGGHCPFCFAGAVFVNCPAPCAARCRAMSPGIALRPLVTPQLIALVVNASAWPRGPPAAA
ncbi:MAG TPA: hypothetical protein VEF90_04930 [Xanthobacteraceae bacterium]|nr:hypothetical protein [Xanthobacteraceae bacterium]